MYECNVDCGNFRVIECVKVIKKKKQIKFK